MAGTQPRGGSRHVRQARKIQALLSHYRASGGLRHALKFAEGVLIGGVIVLFATDGRLIPRVG